MLLDVTRERPSVLPADRATLLIEHAAELATLGGVYGDGPRGGLWQGDPGLIHDGAIARRRRRPDPGGRSDQPCP